MKFPDCRLLFDKPPRSTRQAAAVNRNERRQLVRRGEDGGRARIERRIRHQGNDILPTGRTPDLRHCIAGQVRVGNRIDVEITALDQTIAEDRRAFRQQLVRQQIAHAEKAP